MHHCCVFRAPSELCCTVRSETPTFTRSSPPTSWSRCRSRASSTKRWEIISLATENQPGNCDTDMLPPPGSEPVWWWDSESCSNSVFGETGRRLPDWWAFLVPGLRAEADGFPRHQEVSLSSNICPPFPNLPDYILFFLQVHPPCKEDSICCGTWPVNGERSGRQSHRIWGSSIQAGLGQQVRAK